MRILLLTQADPFYLPESIEYLIQQMPGNSEIIGCVLFKPSPYGKKMTAFEKIINSINIFGFQFFIHYGLLLVRNKISSRKSVPSVLRSTNIPKIVLNKNINDWKSIQVIKEYNPDLLISIAGNQIFKKDLIGLAPKGCLNLHTALLPKYRGLMPTFWVLKNNERETGVSVFLVDEGIDSGPIIVQKRILIENKTQQELIRETKRLGMDAILEAIAKIESGTYELIPNNDNEKTYFSFPTKEDVRVFRQIGKKFF